MSDTSKESLVNQKPATDDIPFGKETAGDSVPLLRSKDVLQPIVPKHPLAGTSQNGILRREIFLAILQGLAARGEFSRRMPGSQLGVVTDADVQNLCRHAAGVASFAFEAAKEARF